MTERATSSRLSTHVLDTTVGAPAVGVVVSLLRVDPDGSLTEVASATTNHDGRTDEPLLAGGSFTPGVYELRFAIGDYYAARTGSPAGFLDVVPVRFRTDATGPLHVPLLVSPWSYTTYRGS